jgi:PAP2 superfamily
MATSRTYDTPAVSPHWATELATRARNSLFVTVFGTTALTCIFFVGYFYIQLHPIGPAHVIPLTALDRMIPFQPEFLIAYLSLWIYLGAGPGLQPNPAAIRHYALWFGALGIVGLLIFLIWPSQAPVVAVVSDFPGIGTLHQVDLASNACPSMHVAAAIFTAIRVEAVFRSTRSPVYMRLFNGLWFAAIVYSTLAIQQHVVLDVVAGAILGGAFAFASLVARRVRPLR